jgi:hypothetical protein
MWMEGRQNIGRPVLGLMSDSFQQDWLREIFNVNIKGRHLIEFHPRTEEN